MSKVPVECESFIEDALLSRKLAEFTQNIMRMNSPFWQKPEDGYPALNEYITHHFAGYDDLISVLKMKTAADKAKDADDLYKKMFGDT